MKVVIALASSSGQLSGVPRHAINLARCLLTRSEFSEVHLVGAPWQQDFIKDAAPRDDARLHLTSAPIGNSAMSRNLWFYARLPKLAARLNADIVHLAYPVPLQRGAFRCPVVVTLHDLYPFDIPQNFGFPKVFFNRAVLRQCLQMVDAIACVSQCTLSRLNRMSMPGVREKAFVICNSVEQRSSAVAAHPIPGWIQPPFVLCVAQYRRNKNILLALRVFERLLRTNRIALATRILIVGIPGPETPTIQVYIAASGIARSVFLLNGISDDQLDWCYRNCSLLLAPSTIEGFGLPVAEAMLAGCRVVCSDIPAFRELGGSYCHYVSLSPQEVEALADAVHYALSQPPPGPVALPQISAPVIAEQYLDLYRSLLPGKMASTVMRQAPSASTAEGRYSL